MYVSIFLLTLVFVLMPIKRQTSTMDRAPNMPHLTDLDMACPIGQIRLMFHKTKFQQE